MIVVITGMADTQAVRQHRTASIHHGEKVGSRDITVGRGEQSHAEEDSRPPMKPIHIASNSHNLSCFLPGKSRVATSKQCRMFVAGPLVASKDDPRKTHPCDE